MHGFLLVLSIPGMVGSFLGYRGGNIHMIEFGQEMGRAAQTHSSLHPCFDIFLARQRRGGDKACCEHG